MPDDILFQNHMARLNITWKGQNADLPDMVGIDLDDVAIKNLAKEAVSGELPGIAADGDADFTDFVVDRFPATDELPARIMIRPKTPFGRELAIG